MNKLSGFNEGLVIAPSLVYNVECVGPSERNREEFNSILSEIEDALLCGNSLRAEICGDKLESLKETLWNESVHNLVTTVGKTDIVDKYFKGSGYTAAWYLLLIGTGAISDTDTLNSHGGWSELNPYAGNRPAITWGTTSSGSNTASTVSINITSTATVAGAGVCSVASTNSGILYSVSNFSVNRGVASGDTLNVTPSVTIA